MNDLCRIISQEEIDEYLEAEQKKYGCCAHYDGDSTPCYAKITDSEMRCQCGEKICLKCQKTMFINVNPHSHVFCHFCKQDLREPNKSNIDC